MSVSNEAFQATYDAKMKLLERIAELEAKEAELRLALKPFADAANENIEPEDSDHNDTWENSIGMSLTIGDYRRVQKAFSGDGSAIVDIVEAAKPLYNAFLSRHGCFPLDCATNDQRQWNVAMSRMNAALERNK